MALHSVETSERNVNVKEKYVQRTQHKPHTRFPIGNRRLTHESVSSKAFHARFAIHSAPLHIGTHTHSLTRGRSHAIVRVPECWCSVIVCGSIGIRRVIGIEPHTLLPLVPFHTDYIDCVSCLFVCTHWVSEIFVAAWVVLDDWLVELQPNECVYIRVITAGCQPERCFPHKHHHNHTHTHMHAVAAYAIRANTRNVVRERTKWLIRFVRQRQRSLNRICILLETLYNSYLVSLLSFSILCSRARSLVRLSVSTDKFLCLWL